MQATLTATRHVIAPEHSLAATAWMRSQAGAVLNRREQEAMSKAGIERHLESITLRIPERRAQSIADDAKGGYLANPDTTIAALAQALDDKSSVRRVSRLIQTPTGEGMAAPMCDDTANEGAIVAENEDVGELDASFAKRRLSAYKFTSRGMKVSFEMLRNGYPGIEADLGRLLGNRIARRFNRAATTGTDASEPQGFLTGGTLGVTAQSATAWTEAEVLELIGSLNGEHRANAVLMAHNDLLDVFRRNSTATRWTYDNGVERYAGLPVVPNNNMPATAEASAKVFAAGNFAERYVIREVQDLRIRRLDERFAESDTIMFIGFLEADGMILDPQDNPIQYLQLAAS